MKKKAALTAAAAALVGTLAVGGTLAWFTDTETATNVVTVGNIDVELSEEGGADDKIVDGKLTYDDVMPGSKLTKKVFIENTGSNDAYVKAVVTVIPKTGVKVNEADIDTSAIADDLIQDSENKIIFDGDLTGATWAADDEGNATCTVYYDGAFAPEDAAKFAAGADAWELFSEVTIPTAWGNAYENMEFDIKVDVYAIQADNFASAEAAFDALKEDASIADETNKKVDLTGTIATSSNASSN